MFSWLSLRHFLKSIIRPQKKGLESQTDKVPRAQRACVCVCGCAQHTICGLVSLVVDCFFTVFHHDTRGEQKTENAFRAQAADCFCGEQSFSPSYVKRADVQLFRRFKRSRENE